MHPNPFSDPSKQTQHLRVGEIELTKIGVRRFDLRDPYHFALTVSWRGFALAVLLLYGLINLFFALLYFVSPGSIANARPGSLFDAFFFSIETLATVGYGEMAPATTVGHLIAAAEIIVGMAFTAIMTGLLFVRFSKPRAKIVYAETAVVTSHNGSPTLMVRIGNGRANVLTNVQLQLHVLLKEVSREGRSSLNMHELKLGREKVPSFPLLLTLMHTIDAASPLAGFDADAMVRSEVRLFVSIEARDTALSATVQDLKVYRTEQIAFGVRYVDAVSVDGEGHPLADMTKIGLIEADGIVVAS